jgi:hypothetical protein
VRTRERGSSVSGLGKGLRITHRRSKAKPVVMRTESEQEMPQVAIISGWKDIANYLGKGVRTVQRYERELGLPVRRPAGRVAGSVIATKAELDCWIASVPLREVVPLSQCEQDSSAILMDLRSNVADMRRLRQEAAKVQHELRESLHVLKAKLEFSQGGIEPKILLSSKPTAFKANSPSPMGNVLPLHPEERRNKRIR